MAGEQFSYEDAFGAPPAAPAAKPPAAVFTDTGEPGSAAQQAFYRGLAHGTAEYASAPHGSRENPVGLKSGEAPPAGAYYVDLDGHLHEPQDSPQPVAAAAPFQAPAPTQQGAPQAASQPHDGAFSYEDAYVGAPATDQRPTSETLGFQEGVTKPSDNAGTWLSKLPGMHLVNLLAQAVTGRPTMEQAAAQHAKDFASAEQTQRPGTLGKIGGEIVGTLPTMALPGGPLVQGAVAGASLTDHANDPTQVAKDAAIGAAGGWLGSKLLGPLAKIASPTVRPDVQTLMRYGVDLTPGQIAGGMTQRAEDASTSLFGLGDAIKSAQRHGLETFNRAGWNAALGDIGESLPDKMNVGRGAAKYVTDRFGQAYETLKPALRADVDIPFVQNVGAARQAIAPRAMDALPTFDSILKRSVFDRMGPGGSLDGQAFKDADTELGQAIAKYSPSSEPKTQALVDGLQQLRDELRGSLNRNSPPEAASAYDALQSGYAKFARLRAAAGYEGAKDGLFTPAHLSRAVRSADNSVGKGDYARGDALLQDLSDSGKAVLPSTVPDSGTAIRAFLGELPMLVGFGAESQHFLPQLATAGIASGIPSLAYIGPGRRLAQAAMTTRPWTPAQTQATLDAIQPFVTDLSAVGSAGAAKRLPQLPAR